MRREFKMSEEQLNCIIEASRPVPYMIIGGVEPPSPRENAYAAWQRLAKEMGFVWDSVEPVRGKSQLYFTAEEVELPKTVRLECTRCNHNDSFTEVFYLERNAAGEVERIPTSDFKCTYCGEITTFYTEAKHV